MRMNIIKSSLSTVTWIWICALVKLHLFSVLSYLEFIFSTNYTVHSESKYPSGQGNGEGLWRSGFNLLVNHKFPVDLEKTT